MLNKNGKENVSIWEKFQKRAEELKNISESLHNISEPDKEKIFIDRANKFSHEKKQTTNKKELLNFIVFKIGMELYAIDVKYLLEIYEVKKLTKIPCTPNILSGVINFRGSVLTIINMRVLLHLSQNHETGSRKLLNKNRNGYYKHKIIVIDCFENKIGFEADSLNGLFEIPVDHIQQVSVAFREKNRIIKTETHINNTPLLIIEPEVLFNDERLYIHEDV